MSGEDTELKMQERSEISNIEISLVVPTYNRGLLLVDTLEGICRCIGEYEIIVVDQSLEELPEILAAVETRPEIRYFRISEIGLPNARNFGISKARGEIILFCDDDVIPSAGLVAAHLKNYRDQGIGGIAGRVLPKNGRTISKANGPVGRISQWTGNQVDRFDSTIRAEVDHAQGCNMSFRRKVLEKIGGFDTRFGGSAFLEETDVCLRVKRAGYRIIFDPEAELIHLKEQSGGCRPKNEEHWYYWYGHNYMLLFLKNLSRRSFPIFFSFRIANLLYGAVRSKNPLVLVRGVEGMLGGWHSFSGQKGHPS